MVLILEDKWVAAVVLTWLALEACALPLILLSKDPVQGAIGTAPLLGGTGDGKSSDLHRFEPS